MTLFALFFLLAFQESQQQAIDTVKRSTLDIESDVAVGKAFATYRWFATGKWEAKPITKSKTRVSFRGEWPDAPASKDFHKRFKYSVKMSMKAMQLNQVYPLGKDKDRLSFSVDFIVEKDGSFAVVSGKLGVRQASDKAWSYQAFSNKALVEVIEGIFSNQNPYVVLCQGLPYR